MAYGKAGRNLAFGVWCLWLLLSVTITGFDEAESDATIHRFPSAVVLATLPGFSKSRGAFLLRGAYRLFRRLA